MTLMLIVQVEPYVMLRHRPLSAAATTGGNSSGISMTKNVKPVQHHLDRASAYFEGFIVDLMDRISNVSRFS